MIDIKSKQKLIDLLYETGAITFTKSKNPDSLPYEIKLQYLNQKYGFDEY